MSSDYYETLGVSRDASAEQIKKVYRKMAMKVRVVRHSDGQIPGWGPAFMRWLPNLVGLVPCVGSLLSLGLMIWALVNLFSNPLRQTPFDLAAKTVVVNA